MANRYRDAARKAAELTNKQLGAELATLNRLSEQDLRDLLPTKRDKKAFAELMAVVEKEADIDRQFAFLSANLQTTGKVVLKLLKYFV
jgi:hypothetical protein